MPILGLDTSSTDLQARDGAMQELHNMRYSGEAWRNVKPFKVMDSCEVANDEIIYQHPADEEDVYIAQRKNDDGQTISLLRVQIKNNTYTELGVIAEELPTDSKVSHFGKILIITSTSTLSTNYYLLSNNSYSAIGIPSAPIIRQSTTLSRNVNPSFPDGNSLIYPLPVEQGNGNVWSIKLYDQETESIVFPMFPTLQTFYGEICYFAVYQTAGGELISPGALNISSSEPFYSGADGMTYLSFERKKFACPTFSGDGDIHIQTYHNYATGFKSDVVFPWAFGISPFITLTIPEGINREVITHVNIYSTRVNPIWDVYKLKELSKKRIDYLESLGGNTIDTFWQDYWSTAYGFFSDNKLPDQPFYLMKSIPIEEFSNGEYAMFITGLLLENLEQKSKYESVDAHSIFSEKFIEYNSRLHSSGPESLKLFSGHGDSVIEDTSNDQEGVSTTRITVDNADYHVSINMTGAYKNNVVHSKILSYPDRRANRIYDNDAIGGWYDLKSADNNNVAYAVTTDLKGSTSDFVDGVIVTSDPTPLLGRTYVKYPALFPYSGNGEAPASSRDAIIAAKNTIRVSAPNNPLVFPLANRYTIGTEDNEIIAVNAVALEMSDSKFGEFPLYIFTKEGIFAMQSGSGEVLYGTIVPLNYDRIINPNTLAVNYNVLYITSRGVHALFSNESTLLSEPINDAANQPLLEFLTTAKMAYQHKFGEVIFYNNNRENGAFKYPNAYTFSLGAKVWATRDWNAEGDLYMRELLNNGVMIQQGDGFATLSDIHEEESAGTTKCHFLSRPIKFDSQEFKRIETLVARLQANPPTEVHIELQASNDLVNWMPCREITSVAQRDLNIRRTPYSARYFRIALECTSNGDLAIMGFDFEYYMRFLHRMR